MNTSEILNKAADLIEERGWGYGPDSMLGKSGVCLMGGIYAATYGRFDDGYREATMCPAGQAVYDYLALDSTDVDAGWEWNDAWAAGATGDLVRLRTAAEVIEVLRATAVIEAARESEHAEVPA